MYDIGKVFEMMKSNDLTAKELSKLIGISPANFTEWKKKRSKPSDKIMLKIASFFGVPISTFYDMQKSPVAKQIALRIMSAGNSFGGGIACYDLFEELGIDYSLYKALDEGYMIDLNNLEKIAEKLNVSLDYILCNTDNPTIPNQKKQDEIPPQFQGKRIIYKAPGHDERMKAITDVEEAAKTFFRVHDGVITKYEDLSEENKNLIREHIEFLLYRQKEDEKKEEQREVEIYKANV